MSDPRYPVGKWQRPAAPLSRTERTQMLESMSETPKLMRQAVDGLSDQQLDTPYRDGGWTARQVVHHVPDSHMNGYVRAKLALTEERPTIKPYDEAAWAMLKDSELTPVETSLALLEGVHTRWITLFRSLDDDQWKREFVHPDNGPMTLEALLSLYSWHGRHHVGHITALRERMGW